MVHGYVGNIEQETASNPHFRRVLYTAHNQQLVVMTLAEGEEIGEEVHPENDQFIRIEAGEGAAILNGERHAITDGYVVIIPAGLRHNIVNVGAGPLKLYTLYSPPHHADGVVHPTKADAIKDEAEHFEGDTTE
ncbi:cupin domain-containing protein [Patescibacteria group bacterium]|nr:cupin domain-containing protein [Patescibacteria group bacterium]